MKKLILTVAIGIFFIAFSNAQTTVAKARKITKTDASAYKDYSVTAYQCPMDCENGKVYKKKGKCPKCGMELKAITGGTTATSCAGKKGKGCCAGKKACKGASCAGKAKASCSGKPKASCAGNARTSCGASKK